MTDPTPAAPTTHPWDNHDDSCRCHISICADCGCTNEIVPAEARDTARREPRSRQRRRKRSAFQRAMDDLTGGCGCACHTGIGYNAACRHCQPQFYPQPSTPQALDVERHGRICHMAGQVLALVELDAAPRSERDALLHRRLREARAEYARLSRLPSEEEHV